MLSDYHLLRIVREITLKRAGLADIGGDLACLSIILVVVGALAAHVRVTGPNERRRDSVREHEKDPPRRRRARSAPERPVDAEAGRWRVR